MVHADQRRAFILWARPPPTMRPMSSHESIGDYTPQLVPELHVLWWDTSSWDSSTSQAWHLRPVEKFEQLRQHFGQLRRQSTTIDTKEAGCPNNAWCSWEKDFFPDKVCPLYFSEKCRVWKSKHIHRKVKCAHLVSEPGSRWHRHVVPGSKKKSPHRNSDIEMHR